MPVLDFLNENGGAITAAATVVLTATTIVYAFLTHLLARENRLLRKAGSSPHVVAYVAQNQKSRGAIDFVLSNVGHGPAFQVSFKIISGGDDFKERRAHFPRPAAALGVLPQGESIRSYMGVGHVLVGKDGLQPFTVSVEYIAADLTKRVEQFNLDVRELQGFSYVVDDELKDLAKAVTKIADQLRSWRSGGLDRLQVEIMTATEHQAEREREHAKMEAMLERAKAGSTPPGSEG